MPFAEHHVRQALDRGEFIPHFQPLVDLRTGAVHGFEILARWQHPTHGMVSPDNFIATAESSGLMNRLSMSLLQQAFAAARSLPTNFGFSVNLSPSQLHDRSLSGLIDSMARDAGFDLKRLTVELTETALVDDLELAGAVAGDLKSLGIRLALDDFGTGYSSLLHLQSLPFDELKVDISFVRSVMHSRQSRKITAAVIGLGISLGLQTVAEGVESLQQAELLAKQGCDLGQGYLYGCAMPAAELAAALTTRHPGVETAASLSSPQTGAGPSLPPHPMEPISQLRAIYDGAPVGLAFLDCDLRFVNVNRQLAQINGQSVQAHIGRKVSEVLPELFPHIEGYLLRALAGESVVSFEVERPPDAPGELAARMLAFYVPVRDEAGEILGVSASVVDVSVVKRNEEALRESEVRLQSIFDATPVGILMVEASSCRVLNANPRAEQLLNFHFTPDLRWDSGTCQAFDTNGNRVERANLPLWRALHRAETTNAQELRFCRSDGSSIWLSCTASPIRSDSGELLGAVLVIQDIDTARRERERLSALARDLSQIVSKTPYPGREQVT